MTIDNSSPGRMTVTPLEEFLKNSPAGFSVEPLGSGYRVKCDPESSLVFIDDFEYDGGKVVFQKALGRQVKIHNLWEYTSLRKSLLSKRIYLLVSVCKDSCNGAENKAEVLQQYVVSINGNDPFIKWQLERGLDWTISSVAGESYRVNIDVSELLEIWATQNLHIATDEKVKVPPVWRDISFTIKYYSDALFDFPHWFGFSKRTFKLKMT